jgi:hypothetical protein
MPAVSIERRLGDEAAAHTGDAVGKNQHHDANELLIAYDSRLSIASDGKS